MKKLLFLAAFMVAILLPVSGTVRIISAGEPTKDYPVPVETSTSNVRVDTKSEVRIGGDGCQEKEVKILGRAVVLEEKKEDETPTQIMTNKPNNNVNLTITPAQPTTNTTNIDNTKNTFNKTVVNRVVGTPAPSSKVIVNNIIPKTTPAPAQNITIISTTTPLDSSSTTTGNTGKGNNMIDPAMVWLAFFATAAAISIMAIIMNAGQKTEEQKTKQAEQQTEQKFAEQKQAFVEKLMGNTDSNVSGGMSKGFVTLDKKLVTVAAGTVPLATPVVVTYPAVNPWQGYINGQPNNQGQPNPGQVQVQPGNTPISSINTTITYATP